MPADGRYYVEEFSPDLGPLSTRLLRAAQINLDAYRKNVSDYCESTYFFGWTLIDDPELSELTIPQAIERVYEEVSRMFPDVDDAEAALMELLLVREADESDLTLEELDERRSDQDNAPVMGRKGYGDYPHDDLWTSLEMTWRRSRPDDKPKELWREAFKPPYRDPLGEATLRNQDTRVHHGTRRSAVHYDLRRAVGFLYHLRQILGPTFDLGCRDLAAALFGKENRIKRKTTANSYLRILREEDLLSLDRDSPRNQAEAYERERTFRYRFNDDLVVPLDFRESRTS